MIWSVTSLWPRLSVGRSVMICLKGGKLHLHAHIGAHVIYKFFGQAEFVYERKRIYQSILHWGVEINMEEAYGQFLSNNNTVVTYYVYANKCFFDL